MNARARVSEPTRPGGLTPRLVYGIVAGLLLFSALVFMLRIGRLFEQGGDPYSDANAVIASHNFTTYGFARLHFLPVIEPQDPGRPLAADPGYYTHYPPGPDLLIGVERVLGIQTLVGWRLVAVVVSLAGLVFWFLAVRLWFGDVVGLIALAVYANLFPFYWLGDSVHHYAWSDLVRLAILWIVARAGAARGPEVRLGVGGAIALWLLLFVQTSLAFDFVLYTQIALFGLGVTGFRGARLRWLLVFGLAPVAAFVLHVAQNAAALGGASATHDLVNSFLQRALSTGGNEFRHFSRLDMVHNLLENTNLWMGWGLGTVAVLAMTAVATRVGLPAEEHGGAPRASRVLGTLAAATLAWFVVFYHHTAEHPFVVRHLLPLASLAAALALDGVFRLASRHSRRMAWTAIGIAVLLLLLEAAMPYFLELRRTLKFADQFAVAHKVAGELPAGVTVASNLQWPAPPALAAILDRRVVAVSDVATLERAFPPGSRVVYVYTSSVSVEPKLIDRLHEGRVVTTEGDGAVIDLLMK